jgi:hypothetical protein
MKKLLLLSFALNLVLLGLGWRRSALEAPMPRHPRAEVGAPAKNSFRRGIQPITKTSQPANPWHSIEAADPSRLIANLRAIGCPEQTIRDIVALRVCRAYRARFVEMEAEAARAQDFIHDRRDWQERFQQQQRLRNEMITTLESLLGRQWGTLSRELLGWPDFGTPATDYLTLDQRRQIRDLDLRYSALTEALERKRQMGELDAEDRARLAELSRQKRADLAAILSPQALEEYLLHESTAANYVRRNLAPAKSESDFRAMVKVAQEFDVETWNDAAVMKMRYGLQADDDPDLAETKQRKAAFDQRLKEVLGEERIAEQQAEEQARAEQERKQEEERDMEQLHTHISDLAAEVGVPDQNADRFFDRLKELLPILKPKFDEMEKGLTGTEEEKKQQMEAAVKTELGKLAQETMGEQGPALLEKLIKEGH